MKPILKKTLIISSSILIPAGILSLSFGLYFGSSNIERISKKGIFTLRVNENLNNQGYNYDYSATYGSPLSTNRLTLLVVNEIIHLETEGKFEYDQQNKKVISPSYESFKFSTAKAIVLNFVDSSLKKEQIEDEEYLQANPDKSFQLVFNSDEAEQIPSYTDQEFVVTKKSQNPRSINNYDVFGKIVEKGFLNSKPDLNDKNVDISQHEGTKFVMSSMGITFTDFNENGQEEYTKWVDSNGNKTKYNVKASDMFYSLKRTWLFDKEYRRSHGGSEELDKYFIEKTATTKIFGETQKFPNEYLFDFFGIDKEKMYDRQTAIKKVNINTNSNDNNKMVDAFIFNFDIFNKDNSVNQESSFSVWDIIKKYLSNSLTFSLAPSEYIDEMNQNNSINEINSNLKITGEARDFGIYTYGQTREKTLFASYYIPVSAVAGREIFEYNKHHANKKWVESVENSQISNVNNKKYKTINKVIVEYTGSIDTSTFVNQSFNSFLNGTLSQIDYSQISAEQKQKLYGNSDDLNVLIKNSEKNGLQATKKVNVSSLTSRMVWQANPINNSNGYTFNDNYSKLVYGYSTNELKNGQAVISNSFFAGYGFNFRLLIQASINWNQFIEQAFNGTRDVWLSGAAQDAKFSSFNANSKTPFSFNELGINDLDFYDENNQKQTVKLTDMKKLSLMTEKEIEETYGKVQNIQEFKMQSPSFNEVKKSMTKLLDAFYQENNLTNEQKIEFNIAYPFADQDETKSSTTKYIVDNVINKLDPRIKANFVEPTSREEMLQEINQRSGAFNANLWSYDYEGIGSYIAAFFSDGGGINLINAVGIFSKKPDSDSEQLFTNTNNIKRVSKQTLEAIQKDFPKFTELSQYIREKFNNLINESNNNSVSEYFLVENWDLLNNKQMNSIKDFFTNNPDSPNQINPINVLPVILKQFEEDASWEKNGTNEEQKGQGWVELIKEFNSIKGVSIDTESSVDKLTNINYTLFLSEYIIPLSKYGIQLYSDFKYEVD